MCLHLKACRDTDTDIEVIDGVVEIRRFSLVSTAEGLCAHHHPLLLLSTRWKNKLKGVIRCLTEEIDVHVSDLCEICPAR